MDFSGKKNVDILEKRIDFLILLIVLKNETSVPSGGEPSPLDPPGGGVQVAGASPPKKSCRYHWDSSMKAVGAQTGYHGHLQEVEVEGAGS